MTHFDLTAEVLALMKIKTERDKQVKVGASNLSTLCTRCLADDLLGTRGQESPYWLGAWEGTAVHERLEKLVQKHRPDWLPEKRVVLGEIPGYGAVKSTSDLYIPSEFLTVDWKTTTRDKLGFIKRALKDAPDEFDVTKVVEARFKVMGYLNQLFLYGKGMTMLGYEVRKVALVFVCRDGLTDKDVWSYTVDYDAEQAEAVWDRANRIWFYLTDGGDVTRLASADSCYYCSQVRDYRGETD